MRKLQKIVITLVAIYLALLGGLFAVMRQPVLFGQVMRHVAGPALRVIPFKPLWFLARAGHLKAGDAAPDFSLSGGDQKSRVQLSSFRGRKPVVLIFGSYT